MSDPYDFLGSKEPAAPQKKIVPVSELFPTAEDWAKPTAAPEPAPEPTLADGNSFLQNMGIGAVESARELGEGTKLWGQRLGGDPNVQRDTAAERERRAMYAPVKQTIGGMIGGGAPAVAAGALTAPVGLPSYVVGAALNALPELDASSAVMSGALSVPGTAIANQLGAVAGRSAAALTGKMDPTKANVVAADRVLREAGDRGLPISQFRNTADNVIDFNESVMRSHPVKALDRLKEQADVTNKELWGRVDQIATANKAIIDIDPANTLKALDHYRRNYGTQHLADLSNPRDSAALLYMMGNEKAARAALTKTLTDAENATPAVADQFFNNVQQGMSGASFEQMRALQQRIGNALGELSGKGADRKMVGGLRDAYSAVLQDMEKTGNKTVDKQLTEALKAASKQHREEVMPFRTGEINGVRNPILSKYEQGIYTNDPSQILADLLKPSERAGFGSFVYPKLDPLEAATVQKIFSDPKMVAKIRASQNPVETAPGMIGKTVNKISEADMVKFSPTIKRYLAANPNVLEDTSFRPLSRAIVGGLRQAGSGQRAAGALNALGEGVKETVGPLFRVFGEQKQPTYVSGQ